MRKRWDFMSNQLDEMFSSQSRYLDLEDQISDAIASVLGFDWAHTGIPAKDIKFDGYDRSFELTDVWDDLVISPEQCQKLFDMGFQRFWLNHLNGEETIYWKNGDTIQSRRK